ncbi:Imm44 family immunity protein [Clostridium estertheticum]|uniref:Imm44 family immunity protein n=1 Tax=Clostridium estertheticum TaxID=238834 RepID=UPI001CF4378E|nr:Imm44 family immunity protein [Clostridium estertheticum]MCB2343325.1 immunity 44 family protein [Clostridium estertheticum]
MNIYITGELDKQNSKEFLAIRKEIINKIEALKNNYYGIAIEKISIISILANLTPELEQAGFFKERKLIKKKQKSADIRLRIDFNKFNNSDSSLKRLLVIKNIIESIRVVGSRVKEEFNAQKLEDDILIALDVKIDDINMI